MLTIKTLNIYLEKDLRLLVKDFNLTLNPGDRVAFVGHEGNGKSTILRAIAEPKSLAKYAKVTGQIGAREELIGYLPQQLSETEFEMTPYQYLSRRLELSDFDYQLAYQLADRFQLADYFFVDNLKLKELSGGERLKYTLICELLKQPTVLLLDEPSNDLDLEGVQVLETIIMTSPVPVIFVSHDLSLIRKCANVIVHFEQLRNKTQPQISVARMDYDSYMDSRNNQIMVQTKHAQKEKAELAKKVQRHARIYQQVDYELNSVSRQLPGVAKNLKDKMRSVKSMEKRLEKEKANLTERPDFEEAISIAFEPVKVPQGKVMLDFAIDQLEIGTTKLCDSIELKIIGPRHVVIVGKNGAGKTTLVRQLVAHCQREGINYGYMAQSYRDNLDYQANPVDFLKVAGTKDELTRIRTFLGSHNFTRDEMFHSIGALSGGQRAKLFFLKMIFDRVEVMILDEPTRNLAATSMNAVIGALQEYQGVIIAISHDVTFIDALGDEIFFLDQSGLLQTSKNKYRDLFKRQKRRLMVSF